MKRLLGLALALFLLLPGLPVFAANTATAQYSHAETPDGPGKLEAITAAIDTVDTDLVVRTAATDKGVFLKSIIASETDATNLTIKSRSAALDGTVYTLNDAVTFTVNAGTNAVTLSATTGVVAGHPLVFKNSGGALPAGLTAGTVYYYGLSSTLLYTTQAAAIADDEVNNVVDLTGTGSGTHSLDGTYIIGSGTTFTDDYSATASLQEIVVTDGQTRTIATVPSDTVMTVSTATTSTLSGKTHKRQRKLVTLELAANQGILTPIGKNEYILSTETSGALVFSASAAISSLLIQVVEGKN